MKKTWIKVKRGFLNDPVHRNKMGVRIWLFLYMIDCANWEDGIVYEWVDKHHAEDINMPWRTIQEQRRKLDEEGYITCVKKPRHQNIIIHNWTNPREYSGEMYNSKSYNKPVLSESDIQSAPVPYSKPRTSSYSSHITKSLSGKFNPIEYWKKEFKVKGFPNNKKFIDDKGNNELEGAIYIAYERSGKDVEKFKEVVTWTKRKNKPSHIESINTFLGAIDGWGEKKFDKEEGKSFDDQLKDAGYE